MQFCEVTVRLGGSLVHTVPGKVVSVPEIKILQAIHGSDAVVDIKPFGRGYINPETQRFLKSTEAWDADKGKVVTVPDQPFDHEQERARLATIYETNNLQEEQQGLVSRLFGSFGTLPERLKDIGVDPRRDAEELRRKADAAAKALEESDDAIAQAEASEDEAFDAEVARTQAAAARRAAREGKGKTS